MDDYYQILKEETIPILNKLNVKKHCRDKHLNKQRDICSQIEGLKIVKILILPILIYKFITVTMKS